MILHVGSKPKRTAKQVAKRSLGKYKRTPAAELKHNNTLFTDLIMEKALEKTVQLV